MPRKISSEVQNADERYHTVSCTQRARTAARKKNDGLVGERWRDGDNDDISARQHLLYQVAQKRAGAPEALPHPSLEIFWLRCDHIVRSPFDYVHARYACLT